VDIGVVAELLGITVEDRVVTSMKVDIKPVYTITVDGEPTSYTDVEVKDLTVPVTVTVDLPTPAVFKPNLVIHTMGSDTENLEPTVDAGKASFEVSAFSQFELNKENKTVEITYTFHDLSTQKMTYNSFDIPAALESDEAQYEDESGTTQYFQGWKAPDGKTYQELNQDLMDQAKNGALALTAAYDPKPADDDNGGGTPGGGGSSSNVNIAKDPNGTVTIDPKNPKAGDTVTVTPKANDGYQVDGIKVTDKDGNEVPVTDNGDGTYSFTMPKGKVNITPTFSEKAPWKFIDVADDSWYHDAAYWAHDEGITTGTNPEGTMFSPTMDCTRAQAVTFLWRAAGEPAPTTTETSFTDVQADTWYTDAVFWAVENGITKGTSDTTFEPNTKVSRGQIATFLFRALKGEATQTENPFTDVQADQWYTDAVLWAVEKGITKGTNDGSTFEPNKTCTRAEIVTFLQRAYDDSLAQATETTNDADAAADTAADADTASDADTSTDTATDTGTDTGTDEGTDAGSDTGADAAGE
jgi:hypothetical protein